MFHDMHITYDIHTPQCAETRYAVVVSSRTFIHWEVLKLSPCITPAPSVSQHLRHELVVQDTSEARLVTGCLGRPAAQRIQRAYIQLTPVQRDSAYCEFRRFGGRSNSMVAA